MRVLHICSYYIGSKLYKNLVINLEKIGIYNEVYIPINTMDLINKNYEPQLKRTKFTYSKCFNKLDRFNFKLKSKKIYEDLLRKIDFRNVDIVHAHSLFVNGYVAYRLKKEKNLEYIVAVRNTDINVFFKYMPWMRNIGIEIMKNAKKVVFISDSYKTHTLDKYLKDSDRVIIEKLTRVIPNGIDQFWLNNMNYDKIKNEEKNIVYVGSIDKNKNIITTIKSIDKLIEKGYKVKFHIVGAGKYESKIKRLQNENRPYIKFYGKLPKERLIDIYSKSDVFVMPSRYETFGLVYVEALTQGTPIIYTKGQGFDGYFDNGTVGFSVQYNDINEISNRIEFIFNNEINIKKFEKDIEKRFNWENISKDYMDIYKE